MESGLNKILGYCTTGTDARIDDTAGIHVCVRGG